jgi:hypothetical protein
LLWEKKGDQEKLSTLSERTKLSLLSFLLLLILGLLAFAGIRTFQAVHNFQLRYGEVKAGDVSTMRPWMTIHAISHVYHVPESYLYGSLRLNQSALSRRATIYQIATHQRQTVDQVIRTIQYTILAYRQHHSPSVIPALIQPSGNELVSPMLGRTT